MFSEKRKILEFLLVLSFIFAGVVLRLLPHSPNFAPVGAIALFAGVYLSKKISFILPVTVMILSDIFLGHYDVLVMASVYGSFLLTVGLGLWLKQYKKKSVNVLGWGSRVLGAGVLSAVLFFLVTNFAVWAFTPWYAKTLSGLAHCFAMALPFFRNTLAGNLFYAVVFFGAYGLVRAWLRKKSTALRPCLVNNAEI